MATTKKKAKSEFEVAIDSRVRISDDNGQPTDDVWIVDKTDDSVIELTHSIDGRVKRIHHTRIVAIVNDDDSISNPNFQEELEASEEKATKVKTKASKPKAPAKETATPESVNFIKLAEEGEIWSKDVPFDHENVKAQSHCVIMKDGKSFIAFNTYNESYGKKGQNSTSFIITDLKSLVRKRKQLEKKGYKCAYENDELNQLIAGDSADSAIDLNESDENNEN